MDKAHLKTPQICRVEHIQRMTLMLPVGSWTDFPIGFVAVSRYSWLSGMAHIMQRRHVMTSSQLELNKRLRRYA